MIIVSSATAQVYIVRPSSSSSGGSTPGGNSGDIQTNNGAGGFGAYAGGSCTNQFIRSLSTAGSPTCNSVANADLAGSIAASKLIGTDIVTVGTLTAGATSTGFTVNFGTSTLSGNVPIGNIVTSTNRDATHFLRGDGSWQTVSASPGGSNLDVQCNISSAFGACETGVFTHTAATHTTSTTHSVATTDFGDGSNYTIKWNASAPILNNATELDAGGGIGRLYLSQIYSHDNIYSPMYSMCTGTNCNIGVTRNATGLAEVDNANAGTSIGEYLVSGALTSVGNTTSNSCGTTAAALVSGSINTSWGATVGATAATSCTITFSTAAPNKWVCGVTDGSTTTVLVSWVPINTNTGKFVGTITAGDTIYGVCKPF